MLIKENKSYLAHFESHTSKVSQKDSCLNWLRRRYLHSGDGEAKDAELFLRRLENDLSACATHRWAQFSRPSPPYKVLTLIDDCDKFNTMDVHIERGETTESTVNFNVNLCDKQALNATSNQERDDYMMFEPSRHIFTKIVEKHEALKAQKELDVAPKGCGCLRCLRPFFGGYFTSPLVFGPTRFLVFPQWMHDVNIDASHPQEIPYFVRGTIDKKTSEKASEDISTKFISEKKGVLHALLKDIVFNVLFARKFDANVTRWRLFSVVDAIKAELYLNNRTVERLFLPRSSSNSISDKGKEANKMLFEDLQNVSTFNLHNNGLSVSFFFDNPRHFCTLGGAYRVAHPVLHTSLSSLAETEERVASITFENAYDSAVQRFTNSLLRHYFFNAAYNFNCSAGLGAEYSTDKVPWTFFGKLYTESWVELPVFWKFLLRIRNQSALVYPLPANRLHYMPGSLICGKSCPVGDNDGGQCAHSLFWATQGPQWNASLLRGFKDTYTSPHYASRWYTLVSAELFLGKSQLEEPQGRWRKISWMTYVNACFMDSFFTLPRASVGVSFTGAPRVSSNKFNVITPFSFECSINWLANVGFDHFSVVPWQHAEKHAKEPVVRLSPAETFHYFRCGLTWKA